MNDLFNIDEEFLKFAFGKNTFSLIWQLVEQGNQQVSDDSMNQILKLYP